MIEGLFPIVALDLECAKKFKEAFPKHAIIIYVRADPSSLHKRARDKQEIVDHVHINFDKIDQDMKELADDIIENSDGFITLAKEEEELEATLLI
ncbi:hypothetical protein [Paenibacillus sp. J22TS3]|uniref:hypothetical protein n=1 Tax=Paenibacillus sp. J22TS3 TaxID=2807192 RepID=UPI001B0D80B6|nr:hypothetical protein [Paenibacillus sp. J22TS3]GIP23010.1 hypothetical protein J22TS3_32850 [Paenibacillus sp. J22TS3]